MADKWNAKIMIPTDSNYTVRICSAEFSESKSSGNPMLTITDEIVTPQEVECTVDSASALVNIAGVKTRKRYYPTTVIEDEGVDKEKTEKSRKRAFKDLYEPLGIEYSAIDWENPDTKVLLGKCYLAMVSASPDEQRKNPTLAQIEEAKKKGQRPVGDVMKHPVTGKPLVSYWPEVKEIFGLAPEGSVSTPY